MQPLGGCEEEGACERVCGRGRVEEGARKRVQERGRRDLFVQRYLIN